MSRLPPPPPSDVLHVIQVDYEGECYFLAFYQSRTVETLRMLGRLAVSKDMDWHVVALLAKKIRYETRDT